LEHNLLLKNFTGINTPHKSSPFQGGAGGMMTILPMAILCDSMTGNRILQPWLTHKPSQHLPVLPLAPKGASPSEGEFTITVKISMNQNIFNIFADQIIS